MADLGDRQAALEQVAQERVDAAVDQQFDLLGLPPLDPANSRHASVIQRKAGRPPGARNRRQEDVARWVVEQLGDPLVRQAAIAAMPVEELAARLGCSVYEAFQEQRLAAALVLPYVHQRQAIAVDVRNTKVVHLTIVEGVSVPVEPDGMTIFGDVEIVENQQDSEGDHEPV